MLTSQSGHAGVTSACPGASAPGGSAFLLGSQDNGGRAVTGTACAVPERPRTPSARKTQQHGWGQGPALAREALEDVPWR